MISRGLAALMLTLFFSASLNAEYLYKDEVVFIDSFEAELEKIGAELREKTGIGLYVVVIKELDKNQTIVEFEKAVIHELQEPAILLVVSDLDKQIDILARPTSLYKNFDKEQVLSPFPNSGTILPIMTMKAKKATTAEKYAAGIQNGYTDLAEQIATSKGASLDSVPGNSNKMIFNILRIIFYGMIIYGIFMFFRRKYIMRKKNNE